VILLEKGNSSFPELSAIKKPTHFADEKSGGIRYALAKLKK